MKQRCLRVRDIDLRHPGYLRRAIRAVGPESYVNKRLFQRFPNDLYIASKGDSLILPSILRPKIKQVDDYTPIVCDAQSLCDSNTQLNDTLSISSGYFGIENDNLACSSMPSTRETKNNVPNLVGNRIISINCLAKAMYSVYHTHSDTSDNCRGDFIFPDINKTQYCLSIVFIVQCTLCNFRDTYKMFDELITNDRGRPAAKVNRQLVVFMTKYDKFYEKCPY